MMSKEGSFQPRLKEKSIHCNLKKKSKAFCVTRMNGFLFDIFFEENIN